MKPLIDAKRTSYIAERADEIAYEAEQEDRELDINENKLKKLKRIIMKTLL